MHDADRWGALQVQQLRALIAIVSEGSFAAAASSLGYTQSGISQQILALERIVGERVLIRHPGGRRPPALTAAGTVVLAHAHALLSRVSTTAADVAAVAAGQAGRVVVITIPSLGARILPSILERFRTVHPGIQVSIIEGLRYSAVLDALRRGDADVAFAARPIDEEMFEIRTLAPDPYVLVTRADRGEQTLDDLHGVRVLAIRGTAHDQLLEQQLRARRIVPAAIERFDDNALLAALVAAGEGVAVVPRLAIDPGMAGVVAHPLSELPPRELAAITRRGRHESMAVDDLLAVAADVCSQSLARL